MMKGFRGRKTEGRARISGVRSASRSGHMLLGRRKEPSSIRMHGRADITRKRETERDRERGRERERETERQREIHDNWLDCSPKSCLVHGFKCGIDQCE